LRRVLLVALAFAGGYLDALSYLGLSRVFTANMAGNTVLFGIAIAQRSGEAALRSSLALGGFLAGALLAAWIVWRDEGDGDAAVWPAAVTHALIAETLVLAAFALGWAITGASSTLATRVLIVLSALAMGAQSAAVHRLGVAGITTTYITGTLTDLIARLVSRRRERQQPPLGRPAALLMVWAVYLCGAVIAAAAFAGERSLALAVPPLLVAAVTLLAMSGGHSF
jgi:uncharacterized membrane protein YoaK (UPF0700 family)